ncbi:MAG TPA: murein biosynthesis integral membrane protein MurJ, partial [Blastocatellia bacterium]|nr:murein biosynthesis integral membrane protein MurJ [Blastocatellia bacterium]
MNHVDSGLSVPAEKMEAGALPKRSSVARSAGIVSMAVMASRLLGLVREMVFAYFFGASKSFANDAYVIAFR